MAGNEEGFISSGQESKSKSSVPKIRDKMDEGHLPEPPPNPCGLQSARGEAEVTQIQNPEEDEDIIAYLTNLGAASEGQSSECASRNSATSTAPTGLYSDGTFEPLGRLYALAEEIFELRDRSSKLFRRVRNLEKLRVLRDADRRLESTFVGDGYPEVREEDTEFAESLLHAMLSNYRDPIQRRNVRSPLSKQARHKFNIDKQLSDEVSGRAPKISKWTRVKAAFRWERACSNEVETMDTAAPLSASVKYFKGPQSEVADSSSFNESWDLGRPRSQASTGSSINEKWLDCSQKSSSNNFECLSFKTKEAKKEQYSEPLDSDIIILHNKQECDMEHVNEQSIGEESVTPASKMQKQDSKWDKVRQTFLTNSALSVPLSPIRVISRQIFLPNGQEVPAACNYNGSAENLAKITTLNNQTDTQRDYNSLREKLGAEFHRKLIEWERLKNLSPRAVIKDTHELSFSLLNAPENLLSEERLAPEFRKKLLDWKHAKKERRGSAPFDQQRISRRRLTDWQVWRSPSKSEYKSLETVDAPGSCGSGESVSKKHSMQLNSNRFGIASGIDESEFLALERVLSLFDKSVDKDTRACDAPQLEECLDCDTSSYPDGTQNTSNNEVLIQTSVGSYRFKGISQEFTRKLYDWEKYRGISPRSSTFRLLGPPYVPLLGETNTGTPILTINEIANDEQVSFRTSTLKRSKSVGSQNVENSEDESFVRRAISLSSLDHRTVGLQGTDRRNISPVPMDPQRMDDAPEDIRVDDSEPEAMIVDIEDVIEETASPLERMQPHQTPVYSVATSETTSIAVPLGTVTSVHKPSSVASVKSEERSGQRSPQSATGNEKNLSIKDSPDAEQFGTGIAEPLGTVTSVHKPSSVASVATGERSGQRYPQSATGNGKNLSIKDGLNSEQFGTTIAEPLGTVTFVHKPSSVASVATGERSGQRYPKSAEGNGKNLSIKDSLNAEQFGTGIAEPLGTVTFVHKPSSVASVKSAERSGQRYPQSATGNGKNLSNEDSLNSEQFGTGIAEPLGTVTSVHKPSSVASVKSAERSGQRYPQSATGNGKNLSNEDSLNSEQFGTGIAETLGTVTSVHKPSSVASVGTGERSGQRYPQSATGNGKNLSIKDSLNAEQFGTGIAEPLGTVTFVHKPSSVASVKSEERSGQRYPQSAEGNGKNLSIKDSLNSEQFGTGIAEPLGTVTSVHKPSSVASVKSEERSGQRYPQSAEGNGKNLSIKDSLNSEQFGTGIAEPLGTVTFVHKPSSVASVATGERSGQRYPKSAKGNRKNLSIKDSLSAEEFETSNIWTKKENSINRDDLCLARSLNKQKYCVHNFDYMNQDLNGDSIETNKSIYYKDRYEVARRLKEVAEQICNDAERKQSFSLIFSEDDVTGRVMGDHKFDGKNEKETARRGNDGSCSPFAMSIKKSTSDRENENENKRAENISLEVSFITAQSKLATSRYNQDLSNEKQENDDPRVIGGGSGDERGFTVAGVKGDSEYEKITLGTSIDSDRRSLISCNSLSTSPAGHKLGETDGIVSGVNSYHGNQVSGNFKRYGEDNDAVRDELDHHNEMQSGCTLKIASEESFPAKEGQHQRKFEDIPMSSTLSAEDHGNRGCPREPTIQRTSCTEDHGARGYLREAAIQRTSCTEDHGTRGYLREAAIQRMLSAENHGTHGCLREPTIQATSCAEDHGTRGYLREAAIQRTLSAEDHGTHGCPREPTIQRTSCTEDHGTRGYLREAAIQRTLSAEDHGTHGCLREAAIQKTLSSEDHGSHGCLREAAIQTTSCAEDYDTRGCLHEVAIQRTLSAEDYDTRGCLREPTIQRTSCTEDYDTRGCLREPTIQRTSCAEDHGTRGCLREPTIQTTLSAEDYDTRGCLREPTIETTSCAEDYDTRGCLREQTIQRTSCTEDHGTCGCLRDPTIQTTLSAEDYDTRGCLREPTIQTTLSAEDYDTRGCLREPTIQRTSCTEDHGTRGCLREPTIQTTSCAEDHGTRGYLREAAIQRTLSAEDHGTHGCLHEPTIETTSCAEDYDTRGCLREPTIQRTSCAEDHSTRGYLREPTIQMTTLSAEDHGTHGYLREAAIQRTLSAEDHGTHGYLREAAIQRTLSAEDHGTHGCPHESTIQRTLSAEDHGTHGCLREPIIQTTSCAEDHGTREYLREPTIQRTLSAEDHGTCRCLREPTIQRTLSARDHGTHGCLREPTIQTTSSAEDYDTRGCLREPTIQTTLSAEDYDTRGCLREPTIQRTSCTEDYDTRGCLREPTIQRTSCTEDHGTRGCLREAAIQRTLSAEDHDTRGCLREAAIQRTLSAEDHDTRGCLREAAIQRTLSAEDHGTHGCLHEPTIETTSCAEDYDTRGCLREPTIQRTLSAEDYDTRGCLREPTIQRTSCTEDHGTRGCLRDPTIQTTSCTEDYDTRGCLRHPTIQTTSSAEDHDTHGCLHDPTIQRTLSAEDHGTHGCLHDPTIQRTSSAEDHGTHGCLHDPTIQTTSSAETHGTHRCPRKPTIQMTSPTVPSCLEEPCLERIVINKETLNKLAISGSNNCPENISILKPSIDYSTEQLLINATAEKFTGGSNYRSSVTREPSVDPEGSIKKQGSTRSVFMKTKRIILSPFRRMEDPSMCKRENNISVDNRGCSTEIKSKSRSVSPKTNRQDALLGMSFSLPWPLRPSKDRGLKKPVIKDDNEEEQMESIKESPYCDGSKITRTSGIFAEKAVRLQEGQKKRIPYNQELEKENGGSRYFFRHKEDLTDASAQVALEQRDGKKSFTSEDEEKETVLVSRFDSHSSDIMHKLRILSSVIAERDGTFSEESSPESNSSRVRRAKEDFLSRRGGPLCHSLTEARSFDRRFPEVPLHHYEQIPQGQQGTRDKQIVKMRGPSDTRGTEEMSANEDAATEFPDREKSASVGVMNVDPDTFDRLAESNRGCGSLPKTMSKRQGPSGPFAKIVNKFKFTRLIGGKDMGEGSMSTISRLCRQSLLIDIENDFDKQWEIKDREE